VGRRVDLSDPAGCSSIVWMTIRMTKAHSIQHRMQVLLGSGRGCAVELPEGTSSSSGLKAAHWPEGRVLLMWSVVLARWCRRSRPVRCWRCPRCAPARRPAELPVLLSSAPMWTLVPAGSP
jgi:hypothetical protein